MNTCGRVAQTPSWVRRVGQTFTGARMGKRGPANAAQTPKEDAERHERTLRAVELRRNGMSYTDISRILEVSVSTAWEDVWRHFTALDKLATEQLKQVRSLELARLDRWLERINVRVEEDAVNHADLAKLVMTGAKLQERRAKLLGLDAPTKMEHTVDDQRKKLAEMTAEERIALHEQAIAEERAGLARGKEVH